MKMRSPMSTILFVVICLLSLHGLTSAKEKGTVTLQGVVMEVDFKRSCAIVNERLILWNARTTIHDDRGTAIKMERLQPKHWVYIEGFYDHTGKRILASKIYVLPKRIDEKERHQYPFLIHKEE